MVSSLVFWAEHQVSALFLLRPHNPSTCPVSQQWTTTICQYLLLVIFFPLLGSWTLERTNMLRLILQLWPILYPILVMIICMLVTIKAFSYPILGIQCCVPQNTHLNYLMFFMFLMLPNHCFLFKNFVMIIMFILNFTHLCFM